MDYAKHRVSVRALSAIALLAFPVVLVMIHDRSARSVARALDLQCNDEASKFRGSITSFAPAGTIVAYTSHYNQQRRECLIQIISSRPEDGGTSFYDEIFNPEHGAFIGSRSRRSGMGQMRGGVVMGSPLPIEQESAAQAWFNESSVITQKRP
jgi:hypothetical protein